jgi:catenin alpha
MPNFSSHVENAVNALGVNKTVDENEFIDASRLVYDGVREIRRAVLLNRGEEDVDSDTEWEEETDISEIGSVRPQVESRTESLIDEYPDISGITNAREAMKKLPDEEKAKIAQQVEVFRVEKRAFDREVSKWDDQGNDVIVLAKHMCMIMMEMTDFTRGRGPLKTTMDVINAAKKISEAGTKLDKLARAIADQCPESTTKKDLLAYLQRIALYCHQLNITSKVKADVQNVSGELIVSGLDSATSLIQAAKNLMNAVVLTVKASYVASTKYRKTEEQTKLAPLVVWRMKAPEKKPLVRREAPEDVKAKVRKGAGVKQTSPLKMLSDFEGLQDSD